VPVPQQELALSSRRGPAMVLKQEPAKHRSWMGQPRAPKQELMLARQQASAGGAGTGFEQAPRMGLGLVEAVAPGPKR
jgi:hypothetical protein